MENRRYVIIQLTEKGRSVFKDIEDSMENLIEIFSMRFLRAKDIKCLRA